MKTNLLTFDGRTYLPLFDQKRLSTQYRCVFGLMYPGDWWTLSRLAKVTGFPESSISARIRDMRKERFGGHTVNSRRVGDSGLHEYQLVLRRL